MSPERIEELAMKASGAEIHGYRFGKNGREPIYGVPVETEDGIEYEKFKLPSWLGKFVELILKDERAGRRQSARRRSVDI